MKTGIVFSKKYKMSLGGIYTVYLIGSLSACGIYFTTYYRFDTDFSALFI